MLVHCILGLVCLLLIATPAHAQKTRLPDNTIWHASPTGSDLNDCTAPDNSHACKTIQRVVDLFSDGFEGRGFVVQVARATGYKYNERGLLLRPVSAASFYLNAPTFPEYGILAGPIIQCSTTFNGDQAAFHITNEQTPNPTGDPAIAALNERAAYWGTVEANGAAIHWRFVGCRYSRPHVEGIPGAPCFDVVWGATIQVVDPDWNDCGHGPHIQVAGTGSRVLQSFSVYVEGGSPLGRVTISGSASNHALLLYGGQYTWQNSAFNLHFAGPITWGGGSMISVQSGSRALLNGPVVTAVPLAYVYGAPYNVSDIGSHLQVGSDISLGSICGTVSNGGQVSFPAGHPPVPCNAVPIYALPFGHP